VLIFNKVKQPRS